jgi:drug/metabolite transporter (DMT)-like permease
MAEKTESERRMVWAVPLAFGCVYFFWGSTYTAIKVGTHYLPALLLTGTRFLISGSLMLLFCRLRGLRIFYRAREMAWLALLGLLMLGVGNFALVWSEKALPSGLAALIVAVVPLYVAVLEKLLPGGEQLHPRGIAGLLLGFAGLGVLMWPSLRHGVSGEGAQALAGGVLLTGSLAWAIGSLLSRRARLQVDTLVAAGWQMLFAGIANASLSTLLGDWSRAHWTRPAAWSIAYLVTFGSWVGYTAYIWLLKHVPVGKVATYAYVNPMVAVLLGFLLLGERPTPTEYAGMFLVVVAVALVTSSQVKNAVPKAEIEAEIVKA